MLDLTQYESLGVAILAAAHEKWPDEVCLIESDRDRERSRLTYRDFSEAALPFAAVLQEAALCRLRIAAIIMTNQPKWLMSAYAIFGSGGVLVPPDYKLTSPTSTALLDHRQARFLIVEYPLWRKPLCRLPISSRSIKPSYLSRKRRRVPILPHALAGGKKSAPRTTLNSARASAAIRPASSIPPAPVDARRAAC